MLKRSPHSKILLSKLIELDQMVEFFTIQNLNYDPKIIEGALKLTEIVSNREIFPHLVNRKFENAVDQAKVRHIFKTTEDLIDFSLFISHCLVDNIVDTHIYSAHLNSTLDIMKKKDQAFKCLVKNCSRICFGYNAIYSHLSGSTKIDHVLAVAMAKSNDMLKFGKYGMSHLDSLFKRIEKEELPEKVPKKYFKKTGDSVIDIKVKCKHCSYTGIYKNFYKHFKRNHKKLVPNVIEGDRCIFENECDWP